MATRMLIDATHDEETRVVIVKGTRLEEFDYETAAKKQLKGNIYLAKVTRVEPSLQAAFVEYGGNRHGFLPFSEIHPDYYQVPVSDREQLLEQESAAAREAFADDDDADDASNGSADETATEADTPSSETTSSDETGNGSSDDDEDGLVDDEDDTLGGLETIEDGGEDDVENLGGDDDVEPELKPRAKRNYKIQEVIKRRQILLVQVVKEERGNKGAALTTYISLPGRYSVLMPNTGRGGGISRKISSPADRKRLKKIASELEVPEGVGVIIRTAGLNRTKVEIKRDYEFLLRLWDDIRELTLKSMAPSCVYEEANLIKRSIRDLYNKDISEILIEGDNGYRIAKDFMRKLMPSHAKKVQPYRDRIPLFHRFQVEQQFASMYNPEVHLKSGGYIVINPTEALVSIDVNSGKATKERSIEETAIKTNLEAAEEIARQLRLRDLAGLIVIDFIDMDDNRNNKAVERRMKDCLKSDRARIQVGRISPFGLMEMSRQRLRPSFLEASTNVCPTCGGSGFVRSVESTALLIIRALEEEGVRERSARITVTVHTDVAIYLLNQKRAVIQELESVYGLTIIILADPTINQNDHTIEREKSQGRPPEKARETPRIAEFEDSDTDGDEEEKEEKESASAKRRRRRRRRKSRDDQGAEAEAGTESDEQEAQDADSTEETTGEEEPRKRRRGKRGGRRRSRSGSQEQTEGGDQQDAASSSEDGEAVVIPISVASDAEQGSETEAAAGQSEDGSTDVSEEKPKRPRRRRSRKPAAEASTSEDGAETPAETTAETGTSEEAPAAATPEEAAPESTEEAPAAAEQDASTEDTAEKVRPQRRRAPRKKAEKPAEQDTGEAVTAEPTADANAADAPAAEAEAEAPAKPEKPKRPSRSRAKAAKPAAEVEAEAVAETPADAEGKADVQAEAEPAQEAAKADQADTPAAGEEAPAATAADAEQKAEEPAVLDVASVGAEEPVPAEAEAPADKPKRPRRTGWWRRNRG
ncbi:Rne/Rng family ribonuclease [Sneathiella chinensis]|uniref:Ribonuclease E n=1 Tax=Sneathiella chinensis TaxID=349750 RepID=A0ABQ5U982_9PROT|nr:ribonuclease E/G [Sneathiella chinensis]GLQ07061.1 hypothetical protein GCM10007924_22820 [Sneathiella chinensis]